MAEQYHPGSENPNAKRPSEEIDDRGLFSCFGKKEEKHEQDVTMADQGHKPSLVEKLHRSKSTSSSSSSEEDVEEDGVKIRRKKKKGLKEKISDKISRKKEGEIENHDAYVVPVEHQDHQIKHNPEPEEKKGILDKLKEKLPGHQKDNEGVPAPPAHVEKPSYADTHNADGEVKEKKGIFEMIKEKLPGGGHKEGEEVKKDH